MNPFKKFFQCGILMLFFTASVALADVKPLNKTDAEKILKSKYGEVKISLVFDGFAHGEHSIFGAKSVTTVVGLANGKPLREVLAYDEEFGWVAYTFGSDDQENIVLTIYTVSGKKEVTQRKELTMEEAAEKCMSTLRQIDGAKEQWALEHKKGSNDTPTEADLAEYFRGDKFPKCPGNGAYTINKVGTPPQCSKLGHKLPQKTAVVKQTLWKTHPLLKTNRKLRPTLSPQRVIAGASA
jgi:hypothetical protein